MPTFQNQMISHRNLNSFQKNEKQLLIPGLCASAGEDQLRWSPHSPGSRFPSPAAAPYTELRLHSTVLCQLMGSKFIIPYWRVLSSIYWIRENPQAHQITPPKPSLLFHPCRPIAQLWNNLFASMKVERCVGVRVQNINMHWASALCYSLP